MFLVCCRSHPLGGGGWKWGGLGLVVFPSSSATTSILGTASLAAVFYVDEKAALKLSGSLYGGLGTTAESPGTRGDTGLSSTASYGAVIGTDSDKNFTISYITQDATSDSQATEKIVFNFDDSSDNYIRNKFNTNPQLGNSDASTFYPAASEKKYWLGETYEQHLRWSGSLDTSDLLGFMLPLGSSSFSVGPAKMQSVGTPSGFQDAVAGWFIGQDLGAASSYVAFNQQKLFRLIGRQHGEWLHKNCKVTVDRVRASTSLSSDYGTFSILIRDINDTDASPIVLERFDNLNLDPTSLTL